MALSPVVTGAARAEHEVVGLEQRPHGARLDDVDGARLEVHEARPRHEALAGRAHVDADLVEVRLGLTASVLAAAVEVVLGNHRLPEAVADLVAALADLDVEDFAHHGGGTEKSGAGRRKKNKTTGSK